MLNGIDVSEYQGNIDFKKVKASGVDFIIIKAGYGRYASQKDPYFEQNYKNAKSAGLKVGSYWYSYAVSADDAVKEAEAFLQIIKGKTFEMPVYFDLEEQAQFSKGGAFCDSLVKAFCNTMEKAGYFAGFYISRSPLQSYISRTVANRYALWIAEYGGKCNYNGDYGMWQNSSTWRVNGISCNVDHDYCYVDYPKLIKNAGLNGFKKSTSETQPKKTAASKTQPKKKAETKTYIVKKGDNLTMIAQKYHTTVSKLAKNNNISNPNLIYPGQKIVIK